MFVTLLFSVVYSLLLRILFNLTFDNMYSNGNDTVADGEQNVQNIMIYWLYIYKTTFQMVKSKIIISIPFCTFPNESLIKIV